MTKDDAIRLLGGTPTEAAAAIGCSISAVSQWPQPPQPLPDRIRDRVQAALWRRMNAVRTTPSEAAA